MQMNRLKHTAKGLATSLKEFGLATYPNLWLMLNKLKCPILLITGENDRKYCTFAERILEMLPHAKWKCISKAGHMTHLEAPEKTADAICRFEYKIFHNY